MHEMRTTQDARVSTGPSGTRVVVGGTGRDGSLTVVQSQTGSSVIATTSSVITSTESGQSQAGERVGVAGLVASIAGFLASLFG